MRRQINITLTICVLLFAVSARPETVATSGRGGSLQQQQSSQDRSPSIVASDTRGSIPAGSSNSPHSGLQSLIDAAHAVCGAATWRLMHGLENSSAKSAAAAKAHALAEKMNEGCFNTATARQAMHQNIVIDPAHCKLREAHVNMSCYGTGRKGDKFAKGSTLIGPFDPSLPTAASPDPSLLGKTVIVRDSLTGEAHAVVITDRGPAPSVLKKDPRRKMDLSVGSFDLFPLRCPSMLHEMEIWTCEDPDAKPPSLNSQQSQTSKASHS